LKMSSQLDKPLSAIIDENKKKDSDPKKGPGRGLRKAKKTSSSFVKKRPSPMSFDRNERRRDFPNNRRSHSVVLNKTPVVDRGSTGGAKIFDRISSISAITPSGTSITFDNLSKDISAGDIEQLCATVGEVKDVQIRSSKLGSSAEVWFARRSDAATAVEKFSDLTLDGKPLQVRMTSGPLSGQNTNVRVGLFGTANQGGRDHGKTTFSVSLGGGGAAGAVGRSVKSAPRGGGSKQFEKRGPRSKNPHGGDKDLDSELENYKKGVTADKGSKGKRGDRKKGGTKSAPEDIESDFDAYLAKR